MSGDGAADAAFRSGSKAFRPLWESASVIRPLHHSPLTIPIILKSRIPTTT
jgi:hypothetical protein